MDASDIEQILAEESAKEAAPFPVFFDLKQSEAQQQLQELFERESVVVRDPLEEQLLELTITRHPSLLPLEDEFSKAYEKVKQEIIGTKQTAEVGIWVYLPWRRVLTHILNEEEFFELRTSYNRHIITTEEQKIFRDSTIGIAGLSTGNNVALALVLQGGARHMRLADADILELANMNRIRAGIDAIGEAKTTITAKQVYELDPFADLALFGEGLTKENISDFIAGPPKLNVIIDTVDSIPAKALLRFEAKKQGIPLISIINNGNDILLDVERYDEDPNLTPFNGGFGEITESFADTYSKMSPQAQVRLSSQLISGRVKEGGVNIAEEKMSPVEQAQLLALLMGPPNIALRLQESLLEAGKTIYSWPQVANAVLASGGIAAYAARRIILGQTLRSGRYNVSIEGILDPEYNTMVQSKERLEKMQAFLRKFSSPSGNHPHDKH